MLGVGVLYMVVAGVEAVLAGSVVGLMYVLFSVLANEVRVGRGG